MNRISRLLAVAVAASLPALTHAMPVAITNAGFEDPYNGSGMPGLSEVPIGAFPAGPAPNGWSVVNPGQPGAFVGVLNPGTTADGGTNFPGGAPEGDNVALLFTFGDTGGEAYGISQILATSLEANTSYTLSVQVGNIASGVGLSEPWASDGLYDLDGFPGYSVQLLANNELLVEDLNGLLPDEGEFLDTTLNFQTGATHDQLGEFLEIRLLNLNASTPDVNGTTGTRGIEVDFDDVRLDAVAVAVAVPGPATALLALPGLLVVVRQGRRGARMDRRATG